MRFFLKQHLGTGSQSETRTVYKNFYSEPSFTKSDAVWVCLRLFAFIDFLNDCPR